MRVSSISAIAAMFLAGPPAIAESAGQAKVKSCQEAGSDQSVIEGRLGLLEGLGPAAFIIPIPGGLCLKGVAASDNVRQALSVQLYSVSAEGMQQLYGLAGQKVVARGRLSGGSTYQQKAAVLMEVIEIVAR